MAVGNDDQAEFWAARAPTWVENEDQLEQVSGEPGRMAMDRLGLEPGQAVLDLGCGTGQTTLELARHVAPNGRALGVDIAEGMLARARRHATDSGATNVEFLRADVQVHDLGEGAFDAAFSRFGVMFYADPPTAFANVRKALRPAGTLSFVCWQPITANDWMFVPGMAAVSVLGRMPQMPEPGAPGPFSLSDPERIRSILSTAGFSSTDIQPHEDLVAIAEARIPEVSALSMRVGATRELLQDSDDATRARVLDAIQAALRDRVEGGEVRVSRGVLLVRATN